MALPPNTSEPEPYDEEEEIIEAGFDPLYFWDRYHKIILILVGFLLLGGVGFGVYQFEQSQHTAAAEAALASAKSQDDLRQVANAYHGTVAAGDALLLLAGEQRGDKKYDDAIQTLQEFLDNYPTHPLIAGGDLSYAETLEAQGRLDDAIAKYEEVNAKYPDSFAAPLAVMAQANVLKEQGKTADASQLYDNFIVQFPDSIFSQDAQADKRLLRVAPTPAPGQESGAAPNASTIENLLNNAIQAQASPAASPAPAKPKPAAQP
jgi:tetratricopeptide (TPR) repeat protein